jgi:hypothetical protein
LPAATTATTPARTTALIAWLLVTVSASTLISCGFLDLDLSYFIAFDLEPPSDMFMTAFPDNLFCVAVCATKPCD